MLKKLKGTIRKQLLKIELIRLKVEAYKLEQEVRRIEQAKQEHHELWSRMLRSGDTIRSEMVVDYQDTRMVGQRAVQPVYVDSVNWEALK